MEIFVFIVYYFCGLFSYLFCGGHVLLMLLRLEFMVVGIFVLFFYSLGVLTRLLYLLLFFLVVVVCESALGLSLLVGLVRSFGGDILYSFVSC